MRPRRFGGNNASQPEGDQYKRLYQNQITGTLDFAASKQTILETIALIREPGKFDVLVDTRDTEALLSTMNYYEMGEILASHPNLRQSRICLLVPMRCIDDAGFFETVAVNRGVQVRAFTDLEKAIA